MRSARGYYPQFHCWIVTNILLFYKNVSSYIPNDVVFFVFCCVREEKRREARECAKKRRVALFLNMATPSGIHLFRFLLYLWLDFTLVVYLVCCYLLSRLAHENLLALHAGALYIDARGKSHLGVNHAAVKVVIYGGCNRAALFLFLVQNYISFPRLEGRHVKTSGTLTTNRHVLYQISPFLRKIPPIKAFFPIFRHGFWTFKQKNSNFFSEKSHPSGHFAGKNP